jgi:hypothetical protein
MSIDDDDQFVVFWAGNHHVCARHKKEGDEHEMPWDGRRLGEDWITPAAAFLPHLDLERSLLEAMKHSEAARAAAEVFVHRSS